MRQTMGVLIGGYAFIVMSYAWVWTIGLMASQHGGARHRDRPGAADVALVAGLGAAWTIAWALFLNSGAWS